jgi:hypothetical protein
MSIDGAPIDKRVPLQIAGALAAFFKDGAGPSHADLSQLMAAVGLDPGNESESKSKRVTHAFIDAADTETAWKLLDELVAELREARAFEFDVLARQTERLRRAVYEVGGTLSIDGHLAWPVGSERFDAVQDVPSEAQVQAIPRAPAGGLGDNAPAASTSTPEVERLIRLCENLPAAVAPLVRDRRAGHVAFDIVDEYDLQDLVEFALRLEHEDVRAEERTPGRGGVSSTEDFFVPSCGAMLEVKVTRVGRSNRAVGDEIAIDTDRYQADRRIRQMLFIVYDLAKTIRNPRGFERDFSTPVNAIGRHTRVFDWPYRSPA